MEGVTSVASRELSYSEAGDGSFALIPTPLAELEAGDNDSDGGFGTTVLLDSVAREVLQDGDWSESPSDLSGEDSDDDDSAFDDDSEYTSNTDSTDTENDGTGDFARTVSSTDLGAHQRTSRSALASDSASPPNAPLAVAAPSSKETETTKVPVRRKLKVPDGMFETELRGPSRKRRKLIKHAKFMPAELGTRRRVKRRTAVASHLALYSRDLQSANSNLRDENARLRTILEQLEKRRAEQGEF